MGENEPRASKYSFWWVRCASIIKKPMMILTLLVKKCQTAMVKLNPELASMSFYGSSVHPSSKTNDNIDIFGQNVPKSNGEIEPRAWKYSFLCVQWASIIINTMIILTLLVKKCQKAMVKLNPEPESMHFYGSSGHPSSKTNDHIDIFNQKLQKRQWWNSTQSLQVCIFMGPVCIYH